MVHSVDYPVSLDFATAAQLDVLVRQPNPALAPTIPFRSEPSFAALCGAAPVPASSGKFTRHHLSRGDDRAANRALYLMALIRMSAHPQTRAFVARQLADGRTKNEILRLLKRSISREIFKLLTRPRARARARARARRRLLRRPAARTAG